ncbi:MAG: hypothetical protein ACAI35_23660 [Candidatus Methylacidiphilales bacterium]|nr:hypothetical protein [Candidatus Methylacidiphilales bacterium]
MWRYVNEAFWLRYDIPGLGQIPLNCVALAGAGVLGFGNAGFWFLGAALEATYLLALATNPRFQAVINARDIQLQNVDVAGEKGKLLAVLIPPAQQRLQALEQKCAKAIDIIKGDPSKEFLVESNRDALNNLAWIYLKLLVAQHHLMQTPGVEGSGELQKQIAKVKRELESVSLSPSLRDSKSATLRISEQRLANMHQRDQTLSEVESDLTRIEAQVDLAVENARLRDQGVLVSGNIDLASRLLDDSFFGESREAIAALDRTYTSSTTSPSPAGSDVAGSATPASVQPQPPRLPPMAS